MSAALQSYIETIPLDELRRLYATLLEDSIEDEELVQKAALRVLTDHQVYGDRFGVPGTPEIVELLVDEIERLRAVQRAYQ